LAQRAPLVRAGDAGRVSGLDLAAAMRLAEAEGYNLQIMGRLLPSLSRGIFSGMRQQDGA
jgi:hypothetical protein